MKKLTFALFLVLIAATLGGAMYVLAAMQRPLGEPLALQGAPAEVRSEVEPSRLLQGKTCGGTGQMSVVLMGVSSPENRTVHGVGAVRMIQVNYDTGKVSMLTMPATLWVNTPVLSKDGVQSAALTQVYLKVRDANKNKPANVSATEATRAVAQTIFDNYGYAPQHYLTLQPEIFAKLVDDLGGIDVVLAAEVDGTAEGLGKFPAGKQHLSGAQALNFVRILAPKGSSGADQWGRFERQNMVLTALLGQFSKPENFLKLEGFIKKYKGMLVTDLNPTQLASLACMLKEAGGNISYYEVNKDMVTSMEGDWLVADAAKVKELIAKLSE